MRSRTSVTHAGAFGRGRRGDAVARSRHARGMPGVRATGRVPYSRVVLVPVGWVHRFVALGNKGPERILLPPLTVTGLPGKRKGVIASSRRHFDRFCEILNVTSRTRGSNKVWSND